MREKILAILEKNSRISAKELAALLGEQEAAVAAELENLEQENVICGYHTLINWEKVGEESADAFIEVKVAPQKGVGFDQLAENLSSYPQVSDIFLVSGNCDLMLVIKGKTMREIAMFVSEELSTIDGVLSTTTQFILKTYKKDGFEVENISKDERFALS